MELFNVQEICARTKALGLDGKVTSATASGSAMSWSERRPPLPN
jgi:hypothetical protein